MGTHRRGRAWVYVLDAFSGTGTSACLHALRTRPNARVVCIERDYTIEYLRARIPRKYWDRVVYIHDDITSINEHELLRRVKATWPEAELSEFVHLHASPSCRTYSRADRGRSRHRDVAGRPLSRRARADDKALRHAVTLLLRIKAHAPRACVTIENPVSNTFKLVPCIARLRRTTGWRWLTCSYCKCADPRVDRGIWPKKNTNFLVFGLPRGFKLPMCRRDCAHLVHRGREAQHKRVICVNPSNWREQEVITDPMVKGRIPHGVFNRIMVGHEAWLKLELSHLAATSFAHHMYDLAVALPEARALGPTLRSHVRAAQDTAETDGETDSSGSSSGPELDTDMPTHEDGPQPIDEIDFEDGLRKVRAVTELQGDLPEYKIRKSDVNEFMGFLPDHWRRAGELDTIEPWTLMFLDVIYITLEAKLGKQAWPNLR